MSENTQQNLTSSGVLIMEDSEFSNFELYPMDLYTFCRTVNTISENENGIAMVIESVSQVKDKTFKGGAKKPGFSFKMVPQEPIAKAYIKQIVDGKRKNKQGELVDAKVYQEDKMGEHVIIRAKDYDKPIYVSFTFKKKRTIKCESSDEYPEGEKDVYVVAPLAASFPLLNFFLQNGGHIPEGNKKGFVVPQELLNDLENFEFMACCEIVKIEGLKPFPRITASEINYDFSEESQAEKVEDSSEKTSKKDSYEW